MVFDSLKKLFSKKEDNMNQAVNDTNQNNPISTDSATVSETPTSPNPSPANISADDPAAPVDPNTSPDPKPSVPVDPVTKPLPQVDTPSPASAAPTEPVGPGTAPATTTPEPTVPKPAPVPSDTKAPISDNSKSVTVDSSQFEEPQDPMDKFDVTAQTSEEKEKPAV